MGRWIEKILILFFLGAGCSPYFENNEEDNSPTSGKLMVYTDTSIAPVVRIFARTFESQYPKAEIKVLSLCRNELVLFLLRKKAKCIVLPDSMDSKEKNSFTRQNYYLRNSPLCFSGISFFCRKADSIIFRALKTDDIRRMLENPAYTIVLPPECSDVPHYLFTRVLNKHAFRCRIRFTSPDSIKYFVARNQKYIGVLEHSAISDKDDTNTKDFFNNFLLIPIRQPSCDTAYFPDPTNFELRKYPYIRAWQFYRNAPEFSLAKGFENFMAGEQGQRLFLKLGLLPAIKPPRNISVKFE